MIHLVSAAKAFADPTRVRILAALRHDELCVCELCDALNVTQSTLSTHLQVIRKANLVVTRKEGKWSYYAIAPAATRVVNGLFDCFALALATDRKLETDARRLKERLKLRQAGACCIGFPCGKPKRRRNSP